MTHAIAPESMSLGSISSCASGGGEGHSIDAGGWLVEDEGGGLWSSAAVVCGSGIAMVMEGRLGPELAGSGLVERTLVVERRTSRGDETAMSMDEEGSGAAWSGESGDGEVVGGRWGVGQESVGLTGLKALLSADEAAGGPGSPNVEREVSSSSWSGPECGGTKAGVGGRSWETVPVAASSSSA